MQTGKIVWKRVGLLFLGVVAVCGVISLGFYFFQRPLLTALRAQVWKTDPALAATTAQALLDFELPPNYQPSKVLNVGGGDTEAVILLHQTQPTDLIYMAQAPSGILAEDEWRIAYEERGAREIAEHFYDSQTVSTQAAVIRGQPTTLRLLEGTNQNGQRVKQLVCTFSGKTGEILLIIVASEETWDQTLVDNFLNTIQ